MEEQRGFLKLNNVKKEEANTKTSKQMK